MQDFSVESFLKIDPKPLRALKICTAVCAAILCCISFVLTPRGIPLDAYAIFVGSLYAITTITAYEEIVFLLLHAVRPVRLALSVVLKISALVLLIITARMGGNNGAISAFVGVFSFIPATLFGLHRHNRAQGPDDPP